MQKLGFSIRSAGGDIRVDPPVGDIDIYRVRVEHPGEAMMVIEFNKEEMQRFTQKLNDLLNE